MTQWTAHEICELVESCGLVVVCFPLPVLVAVNKDYHHLLRKAFHLSIIIHWAQGMGYTQFLAALLQKLWPPKKQHLPFQFFYGSTPSAGLCPTVPRLGGGFVRSLQFPAVPGDGSPDVAVRKEDGSCHTHPQMQWKTSNGRPCGDLLLCFLVVKCSVVLDSS